jgi:UDP-N-acetylmuramoyl-tripeptide--D-alanyl-D-alanine ligase
MAELGAEAPRFHREIGELAAELGVDVLVAVGPLARGYVEGAAGLPSVRWAASVPEGIRAAREVVRDGDCVLVKASRAVGLEAAAEALAPVTA